MVINGVLDFMVEVFGDWGCYVWFVVGVLSLLFNVVVEVDVVFEIGWCGSLRCVCLCGDNFWF